MTQRLLAICIFAASVLVIVSAEVPGQSAAFKSDVITLSTPGIRTEISADITGAKRLYLVANDANDGYSFDWIAWANPKLVDKEGSSKLLTEFKWKSATTGFGSIGKNRNCQGDQITSTGGL